MGVKVLAFTNEENYPFNVSMIGTSHCDKNYHIRRMASDVFCLEYVLAGHGFVSENGKNFLAAKGDTYMLHINQDHDYYTDPENCWRKIWMNFNGSVAEHLVQAYNLAERIYYPQTNILPYMEEIHEALSVIKDKKVAFERCARIFMKILQLLHQMSDGYVEPPGTIAESLKAYIDNLSEVNISLDSVIERIHCSKSYAIRSFKEKYNITPYNYILSRKIGLAKSMLLSTTLSISDISDYLGFCDSHYFSRYFRQHTAVSPSEYRKKQISG